MARLFTIFGDGHVKDGIDLDAEHGQVSINVGDCPTPVVVTDSLLAQYKTAADQKPLRIHRASLKLSGASVVLCPESKDAEPSKHSLVLLDPRCWWHSQNKVNSGITEVCYHVNPKNIILAGRRHFGAEGLTHCQTMLVRLDIGEEVLIGYKKTTGQGGTLEVSKETRTLIFTGETFEDVSPAVLHWRREVA